MCSARIGIEKCPPLTMKVSLIHFCWINFIPMQRGVNCGWYVWTMDCQLLFQIMADNHSKQEEETIPMIIYSSSRMENAVKRTCWRHSKAAGGVCDGNKLEWQINDFVQYSNIIVLIKNKTNKVYMIQKDYKARYNRVIVAHSIDDHEQNRLLATRPPIPKA